MNIAWRAIFLLTSLPVTQGAPKEVKQPKGSAVAGKEFTGKDGAPMVLVPAFASSR